MAIRNFVSQNIPQLKATLSALEKAQQGGSLIELRVSGIVTRNNSVNPRDLGVLYDQCRYELYLRVNALDDDDGDKTALVAQYTNPYIEKRMRVETQHSTLNLYPSST